MNRIKQQPYTKSHLKVFTPSTSLISEPFEGIQTNDNKPHWQDLPGSNGRYRLSLSVKPGDGYIKSKRVSQRTNEVLRSCYLSLSVQQLFWVSNPDAKTGSRINIGIHLYGPDGSTIPCCSKKFSMALALF